MGEASKDLLQMEDNEPSLFESSLLVSKEGETELKDAQTKAKRGQKNSTSSEKEQRAAPAFPASGVLGRVKDFLGTIAEANEKLQTAVQESGRENYDIEAMTGDENEYIEMDLLLGLTDLETPEAVAAAEAAMEGARQPLSIDDSESSLSSEEVSDEDEAPKEDSGPGRGKKRPKITVLD